MSARGAKEIPQELFAGGTEMGALIRSHDWSLSALGAVETWSQSLKTAIQLILGSRYPMFVWWGHQMINLYNDAYSPILGQRHPAALGQSAFDVWADVWDVVGPQAEAVLNEGKSSWNKEALLIMERNGYPEETYFTFSYSPVPADDGGPGGVFCAVTEETERVLSDRRLRTLRELGAETVTAKTVEAACFLSATVLTHNAHDIPFALIYLLDSDSAQARLTGTTRLATGTPASPEVIELTSAETSNGWQLTQVIETGESKIVKDLEARFGLLPGGAWSESPDRAVVLPLARSGETFGFLIAGVSPLRVFDDDYKGFFDLMAGQVTTAISNARTYEQERQRVVSEAARSAALAELNRAKTVFFSNVSHEFRTPLTLMLGPTEDALTDRNVPLPAQHRERIEVVQRNGQRLLKLVNTLVDFSRIEAGRIGAVYEPTDLATYTAELASVFRSAIERANLHLAIDCPPLSSSAYVDREMWEKIVLNLLSNAFKFTFEGEIAVALRDRDDRIELEVRDTGTGIPADELPHIFERFHRVRGAKGRNYEGSGIGLSLVQELVRLHGGTIQVSSVVDRGTSFTVSIPAGSAHLPLERIGATRTLTSTATGAAPYVEEVLRWLPEEVGREREQGENGSRGRTGAGGAGGEKLHGELREMVHLDTLAANSSPASSARILLVDDNTDMRDYVRRLLLDRGYAVETAADGMAALAAIGQQTPDLVLADVMMPRLNGFRLLRELRADPTTRDIPIILLSARAGEEARIEELEAGADDYLTKPFSARELLARVEATLKLKQLRREINEAIQRSEKQSRLAIRVAQLGTWRYALDTNLVELDERMREIWGEPEDAVLLPLSRVMERVHPDDRARVASAVSAALDPMSSGAYEIDYRIVWDDGTERWLSANGQAKFVGEGELRQAVEFLGTALDISDRKRAELEREHLLARKRHYAEQLQGLTTAALAINSALSVEKVLQVITDQAASIVGAHQSVTSMTIDQNWAQAINAVYLSDKYAAWRDYDEKTDGSGIYACVCHLNRPMRMTQAELEAHPHWKGFGKEAENHPPMRGWLAAPLVGRDGHNIGLIQLSDKYEGEFTPSDESILVQLAQMASVAVENARLYEAQQQARAAAEASREEAQAANRVKDEFLAVLSHELRSPLNPILGWSKLLQNRKLDEAKTAQALSTIERNAKLQSELIEDLLDVSRILQGKLSLNVTPINLASTIRAAIETVRLAAEAKSIQVEAILDSNANSASGDSTRLQQVVWNLLANAVKFTPAGGRVEVRLEQVENQAQITISDNGKGIPQEFLPHVFDYFRQADSATTRKFGGLGLGLAIVRYLVELHGGRVQADSPGEGLGATFTVRLPLMPIGSAADREEKSSEPSLNLKGVRVLVVDDDTDTREFVVFVLEQAEASVIWANSADEAFAALTQFKPDILLSDIGMPDIDGYMLMQQVRALPPEQGGQVPAIALTAYAGDFNRKQALAAGFQRHVAKPVEPNELVKAIVTLLRGES